jgi:hypothetical protein
MGAANLLSDTPILKTLYPQTEIEREWHEHMAFYAMLDKAEDFEGNNMVLALRYGTTQGRSRSFGNAQANKTPTQLARFTITRCRDYSLYSIDGETIDACGSNKGAIVDAVTTEVDGAMDAIKLSTARSIYRNFGGAIGVIGTLTTNAAFGPGANNVITLSDVNTVIFYEVGQIINLSATDGTSGSVIPGAAILTAVDRVNGLIACSAGFPTFIPAAAAGQFVFTDGDFGLSCSGLDSWIPSTAPGIADSFFGLNRSVDPVRLAGTRTVNTSGLAPEEALQTGLQQVFRQGGRPKLVIENDADFKLLVLSVGSRVIYETLESDAEIGFEGVKVVGPYGPVTVIPDPNCQQGVAWMIDMRAWKFRSLKEFPRFLDLDKLGRMIRETTADAYEGRIGGYYQLMTDAPAWSARCFL